MPTMPARAERRRAETRPAPDHEPRVARGPLRPNHCRHMPSPSPPTPRRPNRALVVLPLAIAVLSALLAAQMIGRDPRSALPLVAFASLLLAPAVVGRW